MSRGRRAKAAIEVESHRHLDKRANIPTEELREFLADDENAPQTMLYPRDPSLDPQLVWTGKDEQDREDLAVPVVPVYIQEKIHPQALVDDVRRSAAPDTPAPEQLDLFSDFNNIEFEQLIEFYQHEQNWTNRMILGDSLLVMTSLAEKEGLKGQVQTIYIDPPYGIKFGSNWQVSTRKRDVRDGRADDLTRQPEQIKAFRDTWKLGIHSYLAYMRDRLVAARELLTESGSVFVQIGDENVHLVRCLMDEVFGSENIMALIPFKKTSSVGSSGLDSVNDYLLWYGKDLSQIKYRQIYRETGPDTYAFPFAESLEGSWKRLSAIDRRTFNPAEADLFRTDNLTSQSGGNTTGFSWNINGRPYTPSKNAYWKTNARGMEKLHKADRLLPIGNTLTFKRYQKDFPVRALTNWWDDTIQSTFAIDKVYVVQTNPKVVERCILMTTDPGDLVLDPTCGSGTTAYVAEQWGRRWITIDTSRVALALARTRLMGGRFPYYLLADSSDGRAKERDLSAGPEDAATAIDGSTPRHDLRKGFVYKRVPHITLKAIANNPEIDGIHERWQAQLEPLRAGINRALGTSWEEWEVPRSLDDASGAMNSVKPASNIDPTSNVIPTKEESVSPSRTGSGVKQGERIPRPEGTRVGMTGGQRSSDSAQGLLERWWELRRQRQAEIDDAIARAADFEVLYDQPYEDNKRVRVTGPFTVESLSPHRVLSTEEDLPRSEREGKRDADVNGGFAAMILEHLKKAGIQNTVKNERLTFERLEPFAGEWVQAAGEYTDNLGRRQRVGITLGPEHGTVGPETVREAAKEALKGAGFDLLVVCGFAFDAHANETAREFSPSGNGHAGAVVAEEMRQYGKLPVLLARMNPDLLMGEDLLKNTGAGNLFMVFGEPDLDVQRLDGGKLRVEVKGVDVYDPTTGQLRSSSTDDIACWFIDTDYNGESFFVRHAYFTGADEPYDKLKRALRAEVDESAWAELYSTTSRPFATPSTGKIAVKVINHYGDEVLKVYDV